VRYVQDNLDRPMSVDELARHVHLSPRQLTRAFRIHTGQSPAGYVERARLDHAAALLIRSDLPIKQIASEVGYGDVAQFTRAFSRRLGTPPGRFRRNATLQPVLTAPGASEIAKPVAG
jgi:AraC family L-rhamnose operon transcriptional activator RhaR